MWTSTQIGNHIFQLKMESKSTKARLLTIVFNQLIVTNLKDINYLFDGDFSVCGYSDKSSSKRYAFIIEGSSSDRVKRYDIDSQTLEDLPGMG